MSSEEDMFMEESDSNQETEEEFLTANEAEADMDMMIASVKTVIQADSGVCRILLQKYNWNKESLLERFYENPDTVAFLIDAHILPKPDSIADPDELECGICCAEAQLSGLDCMHLACDECWKSYIKEKISEGKTEIECLASECKLLMEDEKVLSYLREKMPILAYRRLLVNNYVESNKLLRWCPGVNCGRAVKVGVSEPGIIVCVCGCRFCFSCGNEGHEPINCRLLKLWLKRCEDDSETYNWININTKDCPKCSAPIEKNGGCNYMRCQNTTCKFEFCWLCFGSWKDEGQHNCNSYNEAAAKASSRDKSRAAIQRYLFYYNRYSEHRRSLLLEEKLKDKVAQKMRELQELNMSWVEVQFLPKAVEVLSECRRTLMFTYAFAFYLKRDNNSLLFEANQTDLEAATEQLSGCLEGDKDDKISTNLKQIIQDKYRYVEQRRQVLLDHCSEGNDLNFWVFNEES